jgi:hypothetical protein
MSCPFCGQDHTTAACPTEAGSQKWGAGGGAGAIPQYPGRHDEIIERLDKILELMERELLKR